MANLNVLDGAVASKYLSKIGAGSDADPYVGADRWVLGSQATALDTGLNSLANNGLAVSAAFNNTVGQAGDGYNWCDLELVVTYGVAPTANTGVSVWLLQSQDGTNYEDGDASVTPARAPDAVFPLRSVTTAQRIVVGRVPLPPGLIKVLTKNDGTGQAMAASGNTVKLRPSTGRAG